jgi:hypothetical protein
MRRHLKKIEAYAEQGIQPCLPTRLSAPERGRLSIEDMRVRLHDAAIDVSNFHVFHHRHVDGMFVSAKNSGTHWLKFMLGHAIALDYGVPPPAHSSGGAVNDIIGNPRIPQRHPHLPRLTSTHTIPSRLVAWQWLRRLLPCPPTVVLVRDIRAAMISNFVKWRGTPRHGDATFAEYVRGDVTGKRFIADAWWYMRFHNRWGDVASAFPSETLVIRYEDVQAQPAVAMRLIAGHFGMELSHAAIAQGLRVADRETMRRRLDPNHQEDVVSDEKLRASVSFSAEDAETLRRILRRHLRYDYGYDYF